MTKPQQVFSKLKDFYKSDEYLNKRVTFREFVTSPLAVELFLAFESEEETPPPQQLNG